MLIHNRLINHTLQTRREWGYNYFWVDSKQLLRYSAHLVLPVDSYYYLAIIESRVVDIIQVPIGVHTTEFLLHHGDSVRQHLWTGALAR